MILRIGNKDGLTLIEVLLAVAILGIGITGVLRAYASSISTLETGQFTINGTNLAKQKMAELEQAVMEEEEIPQRRESGAFKKPFEEFLWEWEIRPEETEGLHRMSLIVFQENNPRTFTLKTYVLDKAVEEEGEE